MPLNCLINNAGMMTEQRMTAPNGFEMCFTANHLSHFLLTVLLLPHLEKTR
jgi:NAD(P)-dependent dehydrogenase (short-subunit alcohol dehydrogenase family)